MSPFQIAIISIFPEMFQTIINYGITRKAIKKNIININILNPRDYVKNKYRNIDDRPYGGGFGMLMKAEPLKLAIEHAKSIIKSSAKVLYLSPKGSKLNQKKISVLSKKKRIILLCGRYQGIDERLIHSKIIDEEISIGDYILSGGELPAMILIDMLCRLLPGALGKNRLKSYDSFHNGLLECPHYTRPKVFQNISVPNILLSGNHKAIKTWRLKQSLGQTWQKRPDLLKKIVLTQEKIDLLEQFKKDILQVK
ncbi:tRNA (guanine-N1)-methyltransferase [Buchnera aphidicola (Schlechtendalia chinensis)]|uniref:tRNA (guanine-N(1)-)-methyltransferase n=1 Tax=Buchnera aphidicola subsp. Schlechtendalia chinensis TaxID=118110 RepID=A0A172WEC0_BUCSC|nr:tRNA (guanosine(37)-N1)-methyltransferase TrmD [Buchnera aphidicola]ANF17314.1 tRNA (guanine-N1)-methyltransferase [Buchnera aphidicola (Schlechtendalia chinensis)]